MKRQLPSIAYSSIIALISFCCASNDTAIGEKPTCGETTSTQLGYKLACGWTGNYDSISLNGNILVYKCRIDGDFKQAQISCTDQDLIWSKMDLNKFNKLNSKTCHLCADGCDYTISVKTNIKYHEITVGDEELNDLPEVKALVDQLQEIVSNIKTNNCQ